MEQNNSNTGEPSHVVFIDSVTAENLENKFFYSLKEALDFAEAAIENNPKTRCFVFQNKTTLKGKVEIEREEYSKNG